MAIPPASARTATTITIDGVSRLAFAGCDYLGLAHHPGVLEALREATLRYGLSVGASRQTTGGTTIYDELESAITAHLDAEAALLLPEGYLANLAVCQTLAETHAVAIIDERAHQSLCDAASGSGMRAISFTHRDASEAGRLASTHAGEGALVLTDGIFTSDGAPAPIRALLAALPEHNTRLLVDDCHGFGVIGPSGRGQSAAEGCAGHPRLITTGTLAKGLGAYGGFIAADTALIERIRTTAPAHLCTTPVPPAIAAAGLAALRILQQEPHRSQRLAANADRLRRIIASHGLPSTTGPAPIVTFTLDDEDAMQRLHDGLLAEGILAPLIAYPGGPTARYFRLTVSSEHTDEDLDSLDSTLARVLRGV